MTCGVVDGLAERGRPRGSASATWLLQVVGALPLLAYDGVEVGHAGGAQVESAGVEPAGDEQDAGHHEDHHGDQSPRCGAASTVGSPERLLRIDVARCVSVGVAST